MAKRFGIRLLLVLLLVAFGVFYGVDIATRGMEQVYGPLPGNELNVEQEAGHESDMDINAETESKELDSSIADDDESSIDQQSVDEVDDEIPTPSPPRSPKITDMIGTGLQKVAQGVVDTVVSVFELFL